MKSIFTLIFVLAFPICSFANEEASAPALAGDAPFASDETVRYLSRHEKGIAFGRNRNFEGVLVREETKSNELFYVDLYKFPKKAKSVIAVDETVCRRGAEVVIGTLEPDAYEAGKLESYENRYGRVCELQVLNRMTGSTIKEYRFTVAMIHGKAHIFVGKFTRKAKDEEVEELRAFVKGLYSSKGSAEREPKKTSRMPASEPIVRK